MKILIIKVDEFVLHAPINLRLALRYRVTENSMHSAEFACPRERGNNLKETPSVANSLQIKTRYGTNRVSQHQMTPGQFLGSKPNANSESRWRA